MLLLPASSAATNRTCQTRTAGSVRPNTLTCKGIEAKRLLLGTVLDLGAAATFNAVITAEDLSAGQAITSYAVDYFGERPTQRSFLPSRES